MTHFGCSHSLIDSRHYFLQRLEPSIQRLHSDWQSEYSAEDYDGNVILPLILLIASHLTWMSTLSAWRRLYWPGSRGWLLEDLASGNRTLRHAKQVEDPSIGYEILRKILTFVWASLAQKLRRKFYFLIEVCCHNKKYPARALLSGWG